MSTLVQYCIEIRDPNFQALIHGPHLVAYYNFIIVSSTVLLLPLSSNHSAEFEIRHNKRTDLRFGCTISTSSRQTFWQTQGLVSRQEMICNVPWYSSSLLACAWLSCTSYCPIKSSRLGGSGGFPPRLPLLHLRKKRYLPCPALPWN